MNAEKWRLFINRLTERSWTVEQTRQLKVGNGQVLETNRVLAVPLLQPFGPSRLVAQRRKRLQMNHARTAKLWRLMAAVTVFCLGTSLSLRADTAPQITGQPVSVSVPQGDTATFSVAATGGNLTYQWRHGTTNLPGATDNPLVLTNVSYDQAGSYSVLVSNSVDIAVSDKAVLTVVSPSVWGWGAPGFGRSEVPVDLSNAVAVAGGSVHSLALKTDGTVAAWGPSSYYGYTNVPYGLAGVVAVAAGQFHSLALKTNGSVAGWGDTEDAQTVGVGYWPNIVAVAAGRSYSMGLKADGTVVLTGDEAFSGMPTIDPGLKNVTAIAATHGYCLTVRGDGTVLAWNMGGSSADVPAGLGDVVAVACGGAHKLALRADGTVVAWGDNSAGQTNVPAGLSNVVSIAAGNNHCLALQADGTVVAWGWNIYGQTNVPAYVRLAGGIGTGCAADHSLAVPSFGPPFITTRLADQVWNQLSLPESVFFRVEANGARPLSYQWRRNGLDLPGETNTVLQVSDIINHQGNYSVVVSNALDVATIPPAKLLVTVPQTPMQAALDNYLTWTTGGTAAWFVQTAQTHDGVDAAQSGAITNNQQSWLETSVLGPGTLTYWWKVSSEADYDFLEFWVDGARQPGRISGEVAWQQRTNVIPAGPHVLRWRYVKDPADSAGQDAAWLDQVNWTAPGVLIQPTKLSGSAFQFRFTDAPGASFTVLSRNDAVENGPPIRN